MPAAEDSRTWVRFPPPPPTQPGRTTLRDLDELEDLDGGFGLVVRLPIRGSALLPRPPLLESSSRPEQDIAPIASWLQRVVICGDLHLPRAALSFSLHCPIVMTHSSSEGGRPCASKRERLAVGYDPAMLRSRTVVPASSNLRISDARQRELERLEEVLDRLPRCRASR